MRSPGCARLALVGCKLPILRPLGGTHGDPSRASSSVAAALKFTQPVSVWLPTSSDRLGLFFFTASAFYLPLAFITRGIAKKQGKTPFLASPKVKVICAKLTLRIAFLLPNRDTRTCRRYLDFRFVDHKEVEPLKPLSKRNCIRVYSSWGESFIYIDLSM